MNGEKIPKKKNRGGYTMIELIVVFALIGMFMASLTSVAVYYMKTFLRVTAMGNTEIAADTVMETIAGELSAAADRRVQDDEGKLTDHNLEVTKDSVRYVNQNGQTVIMKAKEDGILHLHYLEVSDEVTGYGSPETDWYIGKEAYMGAFIESLEFTQELVNGKNLIRVNLHMKNEKAGTEYLLESTKIVELYNLREK